MALNTTAHRLLFNTGMTGFTTVLNLFLGFLVLSSAQDILGEVGLGVWVLAMGFAAMAALVDFGFGPALGILVAKYAGAENTKHIEESINAFVFIASPLGFFIAVTGLFVSSYLADTFVKDVLWQAEASVLFALMFLTIAIRLLGSLLGGLLIGYQLMAQFRAWLAIWAVIRAMGILWLLHEGVSLRWIGAWVVVTSVGGLLTTLILYHQSIPISIRVSLPSKAAIRELWRTAIPLQTARMAGAILGQVDKFVLAGLLGASFAGMYELAAKLAGSVLLVPGFMLAAIAPLVSAMVGQGEHQRVERLLEITFRYLSIIVFAMAGFLFLYTEGLLVWWLGEVSEEVVLATRVMLIMFLMMALQQPYIDALLGRGDKRIVMNFSLVVLLLNIPLSIVFVYYAGFSGSYWASLSVVFFGSLLFLYKALPQLNITISVWLKLWAYPFTATVITMTCMYPFNFVTDSLLSVSFALFIWLLTFLCILWLIGGLERKDMSILLQAWKQREQ